MCVDLLDNPDQFYHHTRRYTTSVVMQVAYGHRVPNWNDKDVQEIYSVIDNFTRITAPGAWIVDSFPTLAKYPWLLPFSNWKQKGREIYEHDSKIYIGFWDRLVKEIEDGKAQSCVGLDLYYKNKDYKIIPKNMVAYTVAGVLEAGSETVSLPYSFANIDIIIAKYFLDGVLKISTCHEEDPRGNRSRSWIKKTASVGRRDEPSLPSCSNQRYLNIASVIDIRTPEMAASQQIRNEPSSH